MRMEAPMLDEKRYYAVFPEENMKASFRLRALIEALEKLEREFAKHIARSRRKTVVGTDAHGKFNAHES
jgi:hypothetical protein